MANTTPIFYTVDEAAKLLQVCRRTLLKLVSARDIPHLRVGRQIRFTPDHIAKFSERATVTTRRKGAQA